MSTQQVTQHDQREGLLQRFFRRVEADRVRGTIIRVSPDTYIENVIKKFETVPSKEGFSEEISAIIAELGETAEEIIAIVKKLASPFLRTEGMVINPLTMHEDYKASLLSVIQAAMINYEKFMHSRVKELNYLTSKLEEGSITEEEMSRMYKILREVLAFALIVITSVEDVAIYLKKIFDLNLPAEIRSPVVNILTGFDIVR